MGVRLSNERGIRVRLHDLVEVRQTGDTCRNHPKEHTRIVWIGYLTQAECRQTIDWLTSLRRQLLTRLRIVLTNVLGGGIRALLDFHHGITRDTGMVRCSGWERRRTTVVVSTYGHITKAIVECSPREFGKVFWSVTLTTASETPPVVFARTE